ncbi:hypothetical protein DYB26_014645 [Aphanomyces astaci]|uniref:Uncharacterized protein n=3 Tax=Aphanomyces astaci TaxID=112090 RepID=A0A397FVJ4_APHAT|nr:hypothetical protein DYB26_014645 [Aphanomyces astaci]RHZ41544.1 hypothetical protein DYB31_016737 [Aphanomyces astaci]
MDEPVKAYAIRLQTILDEVDFPASKGVAMFKRGVRHARAESCLEHTDRELNSITDCMKLLRAREVRLDEITAKPQTHTKPRSNSSASTPSGDGATSELMTTNHAQQQKAFVALIERSNQVQQGFVDALTRQTQPNYAAPIQPSQPYGFAYQQAALIQPATSSFGQPYQQPYAPNTIAPSDQAALPPNLTPTQNEMPGAGRTRVGHTPVVMSSKPDEMTVSGQNARTTYLCAQSSRTLKSTTFFRRALKYALIKWCVLQDVENIFADVPVMIKAFCKPAKSAVIKKMAVAYEVK